MLRPIIRRWWEVSGRPRKGLVFPVLRDGKHSKVEKKEEKHEGQPRIFPSVVTYVERLVSTSLETVIIKQKNGRENDHPSMGRGARADPPRSELFDGRGQYIAGGLPQLAPGVLQALADAGVNAQLAKSLAGHSSEAAHEKYLRSSETARALPEAARPQIDLANIVKRGRASSIAS